MQWVGSRLETSEPGDAVVKCSEIESGSDGTLDKVHGQSLVQTTPQTLRSEMSLTTVVISIENITITISSIQQFKFLHSLVTKSVFFILCMYLLNVLQNSLKAQIWFGSILFML